ncbi:MAG: ATP-binding protein [Peptoniphilus sp.]|nr:ATP-binding protein [Peptoniphilus sp.]MDD7363231.1 ATP-binding protein [Bacillota bacterium]MDY6044445.1 ATP-binding protein [Peptoniphilus sp.]
MQINVVGLTNPREVTVGSRDHNFRVAEFIVIDDPVQGPILGEVVESQTYNRFIPMDIGGDFVDDDVLASLRQLGYDIHNETIYIATVRFLHETAEPPLTGSDGRAPTFEEIKDILVPVSPKEGLVLGSIRNTDYLYDEMDDGLKNLFDLYEHGEATPQRDVPYVLDIRAMHQYPHIGIFGGSGSGKSFGMRVILEELMEKKIPGIILDPHYEMDFSTPSENGRSYKDGHRRFQIGTDVGIRFEDMNSGDLKNILDAVSDISESMKGTIDLLFTFGNSYNSFSARIEDLIAAHEIGGLDKIREMTMIQNGEQKTWQKRQKLYEHFGRATNISSLKGIMWRLGSLERSGLFQGDSKPIEEALFQGKFAVIQGSVKTIQMYATYLIRNLYKKRREYKDAQLLRPGSGEFFPPFFVVTDESHTFAPKGIPSPSKSVIREIAQEGRKYGVFLILATQRPTLLDDTVTAQLNSKMIYRTVRAQDIDTIRDETDISKEESARLPYLQTGDVFISSSHLGRTTFVRIRMAHTVSPHTENPFDELKNVRGKDLDKLLGAVEEFLPISESSNILTVLSELDKRDIGYTRESLIAALDDLAKEGRLLKEKDFLGNAIYKAPRDES